VRCSPLILYIPAPIWAISPRNICSSNWRMITETSSSC
jgi:hypothetical protein